MQGELHFGRVSKKPLMVGEAAAPYATKKPAKRKSAPKGDEPDRRRADDAAFKQVADKVFFERKELLRKLAQ